jgi:hypothetical protein
VADFSDGQEKSATIMAEGGAGLVMTVRARECVPCYPMLSGS